MPSPPGLPEFDLPMVFGDQVAGLGFQSGTFRLAFAANVADAAGDEQLVKSGYLILTPDCMLALRAQIDQLFGELQTRGLMQFAPEKMDA